MRKEDLFGTPPCISAKVSPDSKVVAYVGADEKGVANVFVIEDEETRQISFFETPDIIQFYWSPDSSKVLLLKDEDGMGLLHLYGVDIHSKETTVYTKEFSRVSAKVILVSSTQNKVVVGLNNRDPSFHDLHLLDLDSGKFSLLFQNDSFAKFLVSDSLELILKMRINPDGSWTVLTAEDRTFMQLTSEEAFQTEFLSYDEKKKAVYLLDNRFTDTNQLIMKSLDSDDETVLGAPSISDVADVLFVDGEPRAYASYYEQKKWFVIDPVVEKDIAFLEEHAGKNFEVINQSKSGDIWVVANSIPHKGNWMWVYDRKLYKLHPISPPDGKNYSKMYSMVVESRDGYKLVCYYTLPKEYDKNGRVDSPLPLVVFPHGGPFKVRDTFGFDPYHQWLASCGYAVLSVNFRLSSGFGKGFVNAGNGEWGGKAHLDVIDAVDHCIEEGITQKGKTAIFGGSYGGYESLASLTFTPNYFTCCVAICGPSNLKTVLDHVPQFWEFTPKPLADSTMFFTKRAFITSMGGDPDKEEGVAYLEKCSPLNYLEQIRAPLLLVHGKNDHIVAEAESRQIYESMKKNNKQVTYMLFPNEGHRIAKFENKIAFLDSAERFLSQHLGGKYRPAKEEIFADSSAIISN